MSNTVFVDGDSLAYPTEGEIGWASPGSQFPTLVQRALDKLGLGQTLNSKAVIDIQSTTKGVLFPRMTTTERDAIGSPPNGLLVFNTTDQQFQYYDTVDVAWIPIGVSSGGTADPNYILFPVALEDPLTTPDYPWRLYNDTTAVPDNGTGGTAAITLVRNTTTPLNPLGDFEVAKAGVSAQGSGFSTDFTIDRRHLGRVLQVSFDAMLKGGTYTAGAIRVYLIQDPTGTPVVIEPVNTTLQLGLSDVKVKHIASFQTAINVTSYRLCIHVYGSDTNSWTISYTNFKVWEPIANYGAIITDWQAYTPTFNNSLGVTNVAFYFRRVGSNLEIKGKFTTPGNTSSNTGDADISLPAGLTISTNVPSGVNLFGHIATSYNLYNDFAVSGITGSNWLKLRMFNTSGANPLDSSGTWSGVFQNSIDISLQASVPIQGWGSNLSLSSDAGDGRVVAVIANGSPSGGGSSGAIIIFPSIEKDTHLKYSTSTGQYEVPVSGFYKISYGLLASNANINVRLYKNNIASYYMGYTVSGITNATGSTMTFCNAGDLLDIRPDGNLGAMSGSFIAIEKVSSGSQIIAPVETVACSYYSASTQTSLTSQINFGTKLYDTHGAVTTGASWKFTAPMAGKYRVSTFLYGSTNSWINLYKGNSLFMKSFGYLDNSNFINSCYGEIDLLAGEYIDIRPETSSSIEGAATLTSRCSRIDISRIGI